MHSAEAGGVIEDFVKDGIQLVGGWLTEGNDDSMDASESTSWSW